MLEEIDLSQIQDERSRALIIRLLNLVEQLSADLRQAQQENQRLRDEIARLKGEKGKPNIKPNAAPEKRNYSSEKERKGEAKAKDAAAAAPKNARVRIDREQTVPVDPAVLPADAQFKGYEDVIVQELLWRTDNILFHKEKFYSPTEGKTYLAELPPGYQGQFGPQLKSFIWVHYFAAQVSEPKIVELLRSVGISISEAAVSNLLIKEQGALDEEKAEIVRAGLESSPWQQTDDTGTRVKGVNQHCHILCNPLYTAYFTLPKKDRQSVIDVLSNLGPRRYLFNEQATAYFQEHRLGLRLLEQVGQWPPGKVLDEESFEQALGALGPLAEQKKKIIKDGARVAAYRSQAELPVVKLLVCDDAGQSKGITEEIGLCWVHDGRHYKKLLPVVALHQQQLGEMVSEYWQYYRELLGYKKHPTPAEAARLEQRFAELFATTTNYGMLDERIEKTRAHQACLLAVLRHPEVPLHNNASELGARARVRKRAVSLGPRTEDGVRAWDTGMTLVETARKLGVSIYDYIKDRFSGAKQMPSLAETIREKAKQMCLGASWTNSASPNF